jgi:hypothetical protein
MARPSGEGGVSTISSAAGRNSSSSAERDLGRVGNGIILEVDFISVFNPLKSQYNFQGGLAAQMPPVSPVEQSRRFSCSSLII